MIYSVHYWVETFSTLPSTSWLITWVLYRPGRQVWWRVLHVTMWGVFSGAREQGKDGRFRGECSRRSWSWRSAMSMAGCRQVCLSSTCLAIGDQVAWYRRRKRVARFPDKLRLKLMKAQKCKFKCTTPVRRLLRQHRVFGLTGQLAYQRQDSQSGHSFVTRSPQPKNIRGALIRRVPLTTGDITEMVHCAAPDTRLVRWYPWPAAWSCLHSQHASNFACWFSFSAISWNSSNCYGDSNKLSGGIARDCERTVKTWWN